MWKEIPDIIFLIGHKNYVLNIVYLKSITLKYDQQVNNIHIIVLDFKECLCNQKIILSYKKIIKNNRVFFYFYSQFHNKV